jgi:hypothetical protein
MRLFVAVIGLGLLVGCAGRAVSPAERWIARNGGRCETGGDRLARVAARFHSLLSRPIKPQVLDRVDLRAYSFPTGEVIVTRGLMDALSDDELTAVIGHEIGHLLHDGHMPPAAALTGLHRHDDIESAADDASVGLLAAMNVPPGSMRSALQKVYDALPADSPIRPAMAARIARLP